jgi:hypothetical protein
MAWYPHSFCSSISNVEPVISSPRNGQDYPCNFQDVTCTTLNCRYIWVDFNEYDGEWRQGRMSGQGTFVWKTGERYDGEWKVSVAVAAAAAGAAQGAGRANAARSVGDATATAIACHAPNTTEAAATALFVCMLCSCLQWYCLLHLP